MTFLIDYDRRKGQLIKMTMFEDSERQQAENARLELELCLNRTGTEREVVLLQAKSEEALRLTHGRYFQSLAELVRSVRL